ncbi:hypothetical protein [Thermococcus sp. 21S7]|uniref:hypothetical protein n=1 Tax=Thermococcus sp. 21S7 TaxID=1638221 RepID=UPI00197E6EAA|nr:hypothetical protein [Thermococcus sp. 21S7]
MEVKPTSNVIASMECEPAVVALDGSTTCTVNFELESADTVKLNLIGVDFGGKNVWPNGPSSVMVNKQAVTLTPTNMKDDLTITITINDELANYYFGERPWDPVDRYMFHETYKSRFAGYSYLVKADFSGGITVSDVFSVRKQAEFDKIVEGGKNAKAIVSEAARTSRVAKKGLIILGKNAPKLVSRGWLIVNILLLGADIHDWFFAPAPNTGDDGNNIVGG